MPTKKRLINADSLMKRFRIVAESGGPVKYHVSDICAAIEDEAAETNVDPVEVVRCKDCKYYTHANQSAYWNEKALACFRKARMSVKPDDFCSYGERRTDGQEI